MTVRPLRLARIRFAPLEVRLLVSGALAMLNDVGADIDRLKAEKVGLTPTDVVGRAGGEGWTLIVAPAINAGVIGSRRGNRLKQTRNQKDGLPAQDAHRSVKESADAVDSSRRPPDPQRALREPVSVCNRTSLSHG